MFSRRPLVVFFSVAVAFCPQTLADPVYRVTPIGGPCVYAMGLNVDNVVVGYVKPNGSWAKAHAFMWTPDSGLTSLGGYVARGINDFAQIVGNSARYQAAVWEDGRWFDLEGRQNADAINNAGQVTGLISAQPFIPGPYAPYRDDDIYTPGFLALERPYTRASHGFDLNNFGEVVADCGTGLPDTLYVGVFYQSDASYVILDTDGNYDVHARGINDRREIVGNTRISNSPEHLAVYWSSPWSPMEYMGALGNGASVAYAINDRGQAAGFSSDRAFVWSQDEGMADLNLEMDAELGITLNRASDINNEGVITAYGFAGNDEAYSFLLTPLVVVETASLDIKPRSCPNPLNRKSHGVLPVALVGTVEFDPTKVDLATLQLSRADGVGGSVAPNEGPPGPHSVLEDVATPFDGEGCECHDLGGDGIDDLSMKFKTRDLVDALELDDLSGGAVVELVLSGSLLDGTPFVAGDCIVIVPLGDLAPANAFVGANVTDTFVTVTPIDLNFDGGGFANFARSYYSGTVLTLTAPWRSDGRRFVRWNVDGVLQEVGARNLELVVDQDISLRAIYERPRCSRPDRPMGDGGSVE